MKLKMNQYRHKNAIRAKEEEAVRPPTAPLNPPLNEILQNKIFGFIKNIKQLALYYRKPCQ